MQGSKDYWKCCFFENTFLACASYANLEICQAELRRVASLNSSYNVSLIYFVVSYLGTKLNPNFPACFSTHLSF
ncbi:MAG: hypothetical protein EAZ08_14155, partial [Cytophagales bacterium]